MTNPYKKYHKSTVGLNSVDVYRVISLFDLDKVQHGHVLGHAVKKLLCPGQRGGKGLFQDVQEAIDTLNRHLDMIIEDKQNE